MESVFACLLASMLMTLVNEIGNGRKKVIFRVRMVKCFDC
jgi:hypothetical protein